MSEEVTDRRRFGRRAHLHYAWIDCAKGTRSRATTTIDIGPEGARFRSIDSPALDERLIIHLQVGLGHRALECKGKVCWVSQGATRLPEFGVRFVDLTEEERALLDRFSDSAPLAV